LALGGSIDDDKGPAQHKCNLEELDLAACDMLSDDDEADLEPADEEMVDVDDELDEFHELVEQQVENPEEHPVEQPENPVEQPVEQPENGSRDST
jgi:hypothetical protein